MSLVKKLIQKICNIIIQDIKEITINMKTKINNISIGLPCYNEEKNISNVIKKCIFFIKKIKLKTGNF